MVLIPKLSCNYHRGNSLSFPEWEKLPQMQQNQNYVDYLLQLLRVLHHDYPPEDKIITSCYKCWHVSMVQYTINDHKSGNPANVKFTLIMHCLPRSACGTNLTPLIIPHVRQSPYSPDMASCDSCVP
jgi:hypothetical protein